jgi:hypothetical protein
MVDESESYQPLIKSWNFAVYPCDGFVTSVIQRPGDATLQVSYWIVDASPDAENNQLPYEDPKHYHNVFNVKHSLQTAVKLRPDVALQMALNVLEILSKLPEDVRIKYALPKGVTQVTGQD